MAEYATEQNYVTAASNTYITRKKEALVRRSNTHIICDTKSMVELHTFIDGFLRRLQSF